MKLKKLLKTSSASKIQIIEENNGEYKEHLVDYSLNSSEVIDCFDGLVKYANKALLPAYLLDKRVIYLDINLAINSLYIRVNNN